ncbi:MAG: transcriptional regulator [Candidatus Cloacimonas sp. SDB]|nr:MAG: transcriptional regulator [Candidatus Cloacimonas sp. SDB]
MSTEQTAIFDYQEIDDIIHARIRLAIMTILLVRGKTDFATLKKQTKTSDGNLSTHLRKLEDAGYISLKKSFVERKPITVYWVSAKGKKAYANYLATIEKLVNNQ